MAAKPKTDPDRADEAPVRKASRLDGARFLGGVWYTADGSPLTDVEAQQAHRAADRAATEARERALRGAR